MPIQLVLFGILFILGLTGCQLGRNFQEQQISETSAEVSAPDSTADTTAPITSPSPTAAPTPSPIPPTSEELAQASQARQLGLEYRNQERYDEAISELKKSVTLDPQNLSGHVILGWTLHLAGQRAEAKQALQQALIQDESHVPALNALGIVYLVDGDLEQAVKTHTQALELKPDNEIAHYNLSLAYHRLADYDQAISHAIRATELEPENPHPWVALSIIYWSQEETALAQQAYQQALALDERYYDAGFLSYLKQAGFSTPQIQTTNEVRIDAY